MLTNQRSVYTWEMELSVMRTHSSRSIRSSLWQDRARAWNTKYDQAYKSIDKTLTMNPASVRRLSPAHSSITRLRQWLATFTWNTDNKRKSYLDRELLPRSDLLNVDSLIYRDILCLDILHILRLGLHPARCNTILLCLIDSLTHSYVPASLDVDIL